MSRQLYRVNDSDPLHPKVATWRKGIHPGKGHLLTEAKGKILITCKVNSDHWHSVAGYVRGQTAASIAEEEVYELYQNKLLREADKSNKTRQALDQLIKDQEAAIAAHEAELLKEAQEAKARAQEAQQAIAEEEAREAHQAKAQAAMDANHAKAKASSSGKNHGEKRGVVTRHHSKPKGELAPPIPEEPAEAKPRAKGPQVVVR